MQRRRFIQALGGAAAMLSGPGALANVQDTPEGPALLHGYRRAVRHGRALLVLVVPDDEVEFMARGKLLGGWLVHGKPELLAPLAFTELVCGTVAEISALVPHAELGPDPVVVLIETDAVPALVRPVRPEAPPEADWRLSERELRKLARRYDYLDIAPDAPQAELRALLSSQVGWAESRRRLPLEVEALSKAVYLATGPGEAHWKHRVDQLGERANASTALAGEWVEASGLDRLMLAEDLRDQLHRRAVDQRISGSAWASNTGCGTVVHDAPSERLYMCGMGHVPELSRTFLYFFHRS